MLARITPHAETAGFAMMGAQVLPLVTADDTGGAWEVVETTVGPGGRSPLHVMGTDKVFTVLDGAPTFVVGDAEHRAPAPCVVSVPAGTPHCYRNETAEPVRFTVTTTGAGHLDFLRGMARLTADGPPEQAALAAHTAAHGVRMLPPRG